MKLAETKGNYMKTSEEAYWSQPEQELLQKLHTTREELSSNEAGQRLNRTGPNLLKSLARTDSATLLLNILTQKPLHKSRPGKYLLMYTLFIAGLTLLLPYTALAGIPGFMPLPLNFLATVCGIVIVYVVSAELVKLWFFRHVRL
jgi:hypothetical protein